MGIINDVLDKSEEDEFEKILSPFIHQSDYVYDSWRAANVFDYKRCVARIIAEFNFLKDKTAKIPCGHTKADLWKEQHAAAEEYCTTCRLHDEIEEFKLEAAKWQRAVEDALGLEHDIENHTPEWAHDLILNIRELGNKH